MNAEPFVAPFVLQYTYKRSLGPVFSRFFTALRDGRILGSRTAAGTVLVPPSEYDPETGADLAEMVEVGPEGTVLSWTDLAEPPPGHADKTPFAWALIRLDGADTALLHAVCASEVSAGMRVRPRWAAERTGQIWDILCFEAVSP